MMHESTRSALLALAGACLLTACGSAQDAAASGRKQLAAVPCEPAALQAHVAAARPARSALADGRISIVPPQGLASLPSRQEELTFLEMDDESESFGTGIMLQFMDDTVPAKDLKEGLQLFLGEEAGELTISDPVRVQMGGVRWDKLSFTGDLLGIPQRTDVYLTPFQGRTLMVNATVAPAGAYPQWQERFSASLASLEVRDCALTGTATSPAS